MILPLLGTAAAQPGNRRATQPPGQKRSHTNEEKVCVLPEILWAIGDKYNLYFTVELELGQCCYRIHELVLVTRRKFPARPTLRLSSARRN